VTGQPDDEPPTVAGQHRSTEPFIYVPRPPRNWITIRVRTIHDVVVLLAGLGLLGSQVYADLVQHRDPHYWILIAGLTCLGYDVAVRRDRQMRSSNERREATDADAH
jgi:hypothetical protein